MLQPWGKEQDLGAEGLEVWALLWCWWHKSIQPWIRNVGLSLSSHSKWSTREVVHTDGGQTVAQKLATGAVLPFVCSSLQAGYVQAARVCFCMVSAACGTFSCGRQPWPLPFRRRRGFSSSWLTELMSVPASLCSCPPHRTGEGRVRGRYRRCCWGMPLLCCWENQFPGSFHAHQAQIISAFSINEETMSRDSSGKPNLASSPCRYRQKQLYRHTST